MDPHEWTVFEPFGLLDLTSSLMPLFYPDKREIYYSVRYKGRIGETNSVKRQPLITERRTLVQTIEGPPICN